ncbi:MAG TPA: preprotein translocase subunit SecE [Thermomicrobiaceae bacterium]|nr:preprotein translocase subunit SecE [Thermomicrobiaceae bacterium]
MATRTRARATERQARQTPARFAGVQRLARETYQETKKVIWPDRDETRNLTIVVIGLSIFLGLLLGGVDALFVRLWQML